MTQEESTEILFQEEFKPLWLIEQERLIQESFNYATSAKIELEYRINAKISNDKLIAKYSNSCRIGAFREVALQPGC